MKFDICVGNPPYNVGKTMQIYPKFYLWARKNCDRLSMIFPSGWQNPKTMHGLNLMNTKDVKYDKQIVSIDNIKNGFKGVSGAKNTNIVYWRKGYDNGLDGKQLVYTDGENPQEIKFSISKSEIERLPEVLKLVDCVKKKEGDDYIGVDTITTGRGPYGLGTDFLSKNLDMRLSKDNADDLCIVGSINRKNYQMRYVDSSYILPIERNGNQRNKYKVLLNTSWGGWENEYGGTYSSILIVGPNVVCTETYMESGYCKDFEEVKKHSKYCISKFARTLLLNNKFSFHNLKETWKSVPIQDYTEDFWNSDNIDDIDEGLFDKYNVPEDIRKFVRENIQSRTIDNILGYDGKEEEVDPEDSSPSGSVSTKTVLDN